MHRSLCNTRSSRQRLVVLPRVFLHIVYKASCDSRSYRLAVSLYYHVFVYGIRRYLRIISVRAL